MTRKGRRVEPDTNSMRLHDLGDAAIGEPRIPQSLALGDWPEHRSGGDSRGSDPGLERRHWACDRPARQGDHSAMAFLIGFAAADRDAEPLGHLLDVLDIQGDQLGATEGAGEADQQQRAVLGEPFNRQRSHGHDLVGRGRGEEGRCPKNHARDRRHIAVARQNVTSMVVTIHRIGSHR
jgi:hypothetical protein